MVVAGWMTSDLASPMFARCEKSLTAVDERLPASRAALDAEAEDRAEAAVAVVLAAPSA